MEEKIDLIIPADDCGTRLDVLIANHLKISRSNAARIIEQGLVTVDGVCKRPSLRLKSGMRIAGAYEIEVKDERPISKDIPLEIIYEDQWIIVIDKPPGLAVHPGAGNQDNTLVNALLARYPEIAVVGEPSRPGIVHRLDKMTSGVMVAARHTDAYSVLKDAFQAHEHLREYLAIVYGHMPRLEGTVETFIQRNPRDRKKMTSRSGKGRKAITRWKVAREWKGFSLLHLSLQTGRTHQIRVHLSDMGYPIVGDSQYGGRKRPNCIKYPKLKSFIKMLERQMLHACTLGIVHPIKGEYVEFKSEIPDDMKLLMKIMDEADAP